MLAREPEAKLGGWLVSYSVFIFDGTPGTFCVLFLPDVAKPKLGAHLSRYTTDPSVLQERQVLLDYSRRFFVP